MQKVLLVPDLEDSALGIIAKNIQKFWDYNYTLNYNLDIQIKPENRLTLEDHADLYFPLYYLSGRIVRKLFPNAKVITGVHSQDIWDKGQSTPEKDVNPPQELIKELKEYRGVNVISQRLKSIFNSFLEVTYTPSGIDPELFSSVSNNEKSGFKIGWVGNSNRKCKGYNTILSPLMQELERVEFSFLDRAKSITSQSKLEDYYKSLDLLLITSSSEGQPQPLLEAAACGVPSLTSYVGIVPEFVQHNQNGFITELNVESYKQKILEIKDRPEFLKQCGLEAYRKVREDWLWSRSIYRWIDFILENLDA